MTLLFEIAPGAAVAHWFSALFGLWPAPESRRCAPAHPARDWPEFPGPGEIR